MTGELVPITDLVQVEHFFIVWVSQKSKKCSKDLLKKGFPKVIPPLHTKGILSRKRRYSISSLRKPGRGRACNAMRVALWLLVTGAVSFGPIHPPPGALYAVNAADGTMRWNFSTAAGGPVVARPAVSADDRTVYVGAYDSSFYALDTRDGTLRWNFSTGGPVISSPVLSADQQTVFFGSSDCSLYALDTRDGTLRWNFSTGGPVISSPALAADQAVVYVGSEDHSLYAVDAADGTLRWSCPTGGAVSSSPVVSADHEAVYAGSRDRSLYAFSTAEAVAAPGSSLPHQGPKSPRVSRTTPASTSTVRVRAPPNSTSATCAPLWVAAIGGLVIAGPALSADQRTAFVGSTNQNPQTLHAIRTADGTSSWSFNTNGTVTADPALSPDQTTVYVGSWDGNVYAISAADGRPRWTFSTGNRVLSSPAVSAALSTLFFGSEDQHLYAINAIDGVLRWRFLAPGPVSASPTLSADQSTVFVGSLAGQGHKTSDHTAHRED